MRRLLVLLALAAGAIRIAPSAGLPAGGVTAAGAPVPGTTRPDHQARVDSFLSILRRVNAAGPYRAEPASLDSYPVPDWYVNGKFGIFIHYGIFSVPGYSGVGCWYGNHMYLPNTPAYQYHRATYGPQDRFGYKDFIPYLTARHFDPDAWAALFREAGARFVVPVAEFHDGFPMYDTTLTDWNAARMGPRCDYIGALAASVRRHGLKFGFSNHRAEHLWYFQPATRITSDVKDLSHFDLYGYGPSRQAFEDDYLARLVEAVDKYQPDAVWFDAYTGSLDRRVMLDFDAFYFNRSRQWHKGVVIQDKNADMPRSIVLDFERGKMDRLRDRVWQTDTSVSWRDWSYMQNDSFKTTDFLIREFVDIVSKNGVLLLDIGPRPDGTIPREPQSILRGFGAWLRVNGEAIYGTRPCFALGYGEGPHNSGGGGFSDRDVDYDARDFRFTCQGNSLYAIALEWPNVADRFLIQSLGAHTVAATGGIADVRLLGYPGQLNWQVTDAGLRIQCPPARPCDSAYAFKITLHGLSLERLSAERANERQIQASVELRNLDPHPVRRAITFYVSAKPVRTETFAVPANATVSHALTLEVAAGNGLEQVTAGLGPDRLFVPRAEIVNPPAFPAVWTFDGHHSLDVSGLGHHERLTVSLWAWPGAAREPFATLLNTVGWGTGGLHLQLLQGGQFQMSVNQAAQVMEDRSLSAPGAAHGWRHCLVTYDGPGHAAAIYVNGQLEKRLSANNAVPINLDNFRLGAWDDLTRPFRGRMADVRIYNRILGGEAIRQVLLGQPVPEGLLAAWDFSRANGTTVPDTSGHGHDAAVRGRAAN